MFQPNHPVRCGLSRLRAEAFRESAVEPLPAEPIAPVFPHVCIMFASTPTRQVPRERRIRHDGRLGSPPWQRRRQRRSG
jgi:hypothetical protein